jgi:hypothetical protein
MILALSMDASGQDRKRLRSRLRELHSPSVTHGSRVAIAYAVLLPERFRGCCPFGAATLFWVGTLPRRRSSVLIIGPSEIAEIAKSSANRVTKLFRQAPPSSISRPMGAHESRVRPRSREEHLT